ASDAGAAMARYIPEIDGVIRYEAPWVKNAAAQRPAAVLELRDDVAARRFDAAIIFTVYSQNPLPAAMLCFLADIPLRLAHCREHPYQLLTHWVRDPEPSNPVRHEVRRQLDLVGTVGCRTSDERLSIRFSEVVRSRVQALVGEIGIDQSRPWIVLHAGASAES